MKLKVYTSDGGNSKKKEFAIPEFEGDKGLYALKQTVIAYQANQRLGCASTKTRGEVRGSGKKPWRQKGTGMARAGSRRSPIWRGGGITFGPRIRDYSQQINKKVKTLAFQRAIFDRVVDGDVGVIERIEISEPKTKLLNGIIEKIAPQGSVLVVDDNFSDPAKLAARNIERVAITEADTVNAFDFTHYDKIILSTKGIEKVLIRVQKGKP